MHQEILLGLYMWSGVVCDLPRGVTKPPPRIDCDGPEPDRTTNRSFFKDLPQPNMMPPIGALAVRFFEGQLLLFSLVIERTDRCVVVWPIKHHATDDFDTRPQRNRIGGKPVGRIDRTGDVFLC